MTAKLELIDNDYNEELFTEVLKDVKQRKGQAKFRKLLLTKHITCALCSVEAYHTRASHIKPWASSSDYERLYINNGLLLCPNHDYLFDKGLISFGESENILISRSLSSSQRMSFNVNEKLCIQISEKMEKYIVITINLSLNHKQQA
ncbi:HNH endonuclease [Lysinibacillus sp. SGAir0095]|uniref:HNH endonuclease n=1 Tax=Lysinibacillus sp. SGAir0095 TaxID=2070463 RepID=UPI0010CD14DE|nr:hypothetical protein C1N55_16035 [Lysinibacillus sp. SGAir0095]